MTPTINAIKNIFNTLPTGYYLGRPVTIQFDSVSTQSYYDPAKDMINISGPMIFEAIKNVDVDNDTLEMLVRGVVYHELSHVILTPANLMRHVSNTRIMNVFEDERIETLCADVYMNTDFKTTVKIINGYTGPTLPKNAFDAFYQAVRFHNCSPEILKKIMNIIKKYASMANTQENWSLMRDMDDYSMDVMTLYNEIAKDFQNMMNMLSQMQKDMNNNGKGNDESKNMSSNSKNTSNEKNNSNDEDNEKESDSTDSTNEQNSEEKNSGSSEEKQEEHDEDQGNESYPNSMVNNNSSAKNDNQKSDSHDKSTQQNIAHGKYSNDSSNTQEETTETNSTSKEDGESEEDKKKRELKDSLEKEIKEMSMNKDTFVQATNKVINRFYDPNLEVRLAEIINRKMKRQALNGAAIQGYSGALDIRSIGERDDYRWWIQKNRAGHIKQFSKMHINLFIDNSGSFSDNDERMNTFIRALNRISDPDFSFDVITINTEVKEWANTMQIFKSTGCNRLSNDIAQVIQRHQKPGTNTYNIVLFDGDCHSDEYRRQDPEPLRWFDTHNTILITDDDNEKYIKSAKFSKAKTKIITRDYCSVFIDEILELLDRAS